ncbi:hypothetical protein MYX78_04825 [Acidobacteria bacterium AH-259-G07]|nr:hypothetical protein [Acidobacteria bacterium AH-259-G07]
MRLHKRKIVIGEDVKFQDGAQHEEADSTLMLAHNLLLNVLDLEKEHFDLNDAEIQLQICFKDFQEIWRQPGAEPLESA